MRLLAPLFAGCCILLLTGCLSAKQYAAFPDQAKRVEDPAKGRIYVLRPSRINGLEFIPISDGGKVIGQTTRWSYLCWEREPGETMITSSAEGVSQVALTVCPDNVYYIFQHMCLGWLRSRTELELINQEKAGEMMKKCKPPKLEPQNAPPSAVGH